VVTYLQHSLASRRNPRNSAWLRFVLRVAEIEEIKADEVDQNNIMFRRCRCITQKMSEGYECAAGRWVQSHKESRKGPDLGWTSCVVQSNECNNGQANVGLECLLAAVVVVVPKNERAWDEIRPTQTTTDTSRNEAVQSTKREKRALTT